MLDGAIRSPTRYDINSTGGSGVLIGQIVETFHRQVHEL